MAWRLASLAEDLYDLGFRTAQARADGDSAWLRNLESALHRARRRILASAEELRGLAEGT